MGLEYNYRKDASPGYRHEIEVGHRRVHQFFAEYALENGQVYTFRRHAQPEVKEWLDAHTPGWNTFNFKVINAFCFQTKEHAMLFKLTWA
jgi:hypothetical protein